VEIFMRQPAVSKPYFLGPKSENETWVRDQLEAVLGDWFGWRKSLFAGDPVAIAPSDRVQPSYGRAQTLVGERLAELVTQLRGEVPTHTPRYMGHMVSDLALPALLGHFAALLHNPNNTSREVSKVGSVIEAEAIAMLAEMVGFDARNARGHFTSGGTVANLEAVWRARYRMDHRLALALVLAEQHGAPLDPFAAAHMTSSRYRALAAEHGLDDAAMRARSAVLGNPYEIAHRIGLQSGRPYRGAVILAPGHKHYSWVKAANVFGLGEEAFWSVPLDAEGRLALDALADRIEEARHRGQPVLVVVSVAGTTECGELDPIDGVADLIEGLRRRDGVDIWHHVDAAFGGYFCGLDASAGQVSAAQQRALDAVRRADSVTIDPHKLGYAPYACGAILMRDSEHDRVSSFAAPYVERTELGEAAWTRTLEGSRPATGAAAVWLTGKTLGFGPEGLGAILGSTIEACRTIRSALAQAIPLVRPLDPTDTNIFCFSLAEEGEALSLANARTAAAHVAIAGSPHFSMSRTTLARDACPALIDAHVASYGGVRDADTLVLLRCVVMNPFWAEESVRKRLIPELIGELKQIIAATGPKASQPAGLAKTPESLAP
jgi:glutamate/tyrosine decarboxylase-like PLP-dependent enzyme